MSKAFDTANREKLINLLQEVVSDQGNMQIIRILFGNTTLAVKVGKTIGPKFLFDYKQVFKRKAKKIVR